MLGTDTHNDISPLPYPRIGNALHVVGLVAMGLWLIDNGNLEEERRLAEHLLFNMPPAEGDETLRLAPEDWRAQTREQKIAINQHHIAVISEHFRKVVKTSIPAARLPLDQRLDGTA